MKVLTVREMTTEDLRFVDGEFEQRLYAGMLREKLGPAIVIEDEQGVVCMGGAVIIWPGVAELWFRLIRTSHLLSLMKELRRLLEKGVKHFKIRRIQACVEDGFGKGCRFAEFMGFHREALLKKYSYDGKDSIIYTRLF